jgi:hypothetical protein
MEGTAMSDVDLDVMGPIDDLVVAFVYENRWA